jgi:hypothetical protein
VLLIIELDLAASAKVSVGIDDITGGFQAVFSQNASVSVTHSLESKMSGSLVKTEVKYLTSRVCFLCFFSSLFLITK